MIKDKKSNTQEPENESMDIIESDDIAEIEAEPVEENEENSGGKLTFAQSMGITRTVIRPPEESDIKLRPDRIGRYFRKYLSRFVFVEFSDEYMARTKTTDIMKGVPVPLRKADLKNFNGGNGLDPRDLAENMAWVMGCDPHFKYTGNYVDFLLKIFNLKIAEGMLRKGRDAAEEEEYDDACVHFRACLCVRPDYLHGMYSYARVCRAMYLESSNEEYVGRFKAEALDYFELVTETHPRFAQGYYYLGYAYLNMGLYAKTAAAWRWFLKFTRNGKDRREIRKRLEQIKEPIEIEEGCNLVLAGKNEEALAVLEPYLDSRFNDWWPLHYYTGIAYLETGNKAEAVARFKNVLQRNGSHIETMQELLRIYEESGDKENAKKFRQKIEMIQQQIEEDRAARVKEEERLKREEEAREAKFAADKLREDKVKEKIIKGDDKKEEQETPKKRNIKRLDRKH